MSSRYNFVRRISELFRNIFHRRINPDNSGLREGDKESNSGVLACQNMNTDHVSTVDHNRGEGRSSLPFNQVPGRKGSSGARNPNPQEKEQAGLSSRMEDSEQPQAKYVPRRVQNPPPLQQDFKRSRTGGIPEDMRPLEMLEVCEQNIWTRRGAICEEKEKVTFYQTVDLWSLRKQLILQSRLQECGLL